MTDSRLTDLERRIVADAIDWYNEHYTRTMIEFDDEWETALGRAVTALLDARKVAPSGQLTFIREHPDDEVTR
jgi:hypothetical protein